MRLCIADPPYLGKAAMLYGDDTRHAMNVGGNIDRCYKADYHPEAAIWDEPATHQQLVARLVADYDGWAIAMLPDNLKQYLAWVPARTRIAVWHMPSVMPTGAHPRRRWEAVLVYVPDGRRRIIDLGERHPWPDVLHAAHPAPQDGRSFAGRKPSQWTRWVLGMLGYDQHSDTVDDLFHGTGAVAAEAAQLTLYG
jgi:hypothetical protein